MTNTLLQNEIELDSEDHKNLQSKIIRTRGMQNPQGGSKVEMIDIIQLNLPIQGFTQCDPNCVQHLA